MIGKDVVERILDCRHYGPRRACRRDPLSTLLPFWGCRSVIRADRSISVALSPGKATKSHLQPGERKVDVRPGHQDPAAAPLGKALCTMSSQGLVPALAGLAFNYV